MRVVCEIFIYIVYLIETVSANAKKKHFEARLMCIIVSNALEMSKKLQKYVKEVFEAF